MSLKTIITTGAKLPQDVLKLADCYMCLDEGRVEIADMDTGFPSGYYQECVCRV